MVILSSPNAIADFVAHPKSFVRSRSEQLKFNELVSPLCAIALSDGEEWRNHTKLMTKFYFQNNLKRVCEAFKRHVDVFLDKLSDGGDLMDCLHGLSLDIICSVAFNRDLGVQKEDTSELAQAVLIIFNSLRDAVFKTGSSVHASDAHVAAMDVLRKFVDETLADRLRMDRTEWPADFLSLFANEFESGKFSLEEILGELSMVICAGYDTTSNTIGFVLQHLSDTPHVVQALETEVDSVIGAFADPSYEDLTENLPYLHAVLKESQRLDPVGLWVSRVTVQDMQVEGYHIPSGTTVIVNNYAMCRKNDVYENATQFNPERFLQTTEKTPSYPFGVGLRACQGQKLAKLEAYYVLARIVQRFHISRTPGGKSSKSVEFTLTPHTAVDFVERNEINLTASC
jgi:cholestanetriol 26-monooxygenase